MKNYHHWLLCVGGVVLLAAVTLGAEWLLYRSSQKQVQEQVSASVANAKLSIDRWAHLHQRQASYWAQSPLVISATQVLTSANYSTSELLAHPANVKLRRFFSPFIKSLELRGYFVISPEGISLSSSRDNNIGTKNLLVKYPDIWQRIKQNQTVMTMPLRSDVPLNIDDNVLAPTMFAVSPVFENGELLGYFALRVEYVQGFASILENLRLGQTGETYVFDSAGLMLTPSRFEKQLVSVGVLGSGQSSVFNMMIRDPQVNLLDGEISSLPVAQQLPTKMLESVLAQGKGFDLDGYRDYRGVDVVGAWVWDTDLNIGIASEIDVDEAFQGYQIFVWVNRLFAFVVGAMLLLLISIYRSKQQRIEIANMQNQSTFEQAASGIAHVGLDGRFLRVNNKWSDIVGYSAEELQAIGFQQITHPEDLNADLALLEQTLDGLRTTYSMDKRYIHKNGNIIWVNLTVSLIRNAAKEPIHFVSVIQDISHIKSIEEELRLSESELSRLNSNLEAKVAERTREITRVKEEFENLLLYSGDGICGLDEHGITTFANHKALELTGYTKSEMVGQSQHALIHAKYTDGRDYPIECCPIQEALRKGIVIHRDDESFWRKDGSSFPVEYTASPLRINGQSLGVAVVFRDISVRKITEEKLIQAKESAEQAAEMKGAFLANMSHEIRTPMNAILGLSDILRQSELPDKEQNYVAKIHHSAKSLLGIINDVLDFSKIEAGKLDIVNVEFDIRSLVLRVIDTFSLKAKERHIDFRADISPEISSLVQGDPLRINQILLNLTSNAIKFTQKGFVHIHCFIAEHLDDGEVIQFEVRDSGIGLTPEQQNRLFESFAQADVSTTREFGGTGLGLSICKRLVEMMHGQIWVISTSGQGSCFGFRLPFKHAEASLTTSQKVMVLLVATDPITNELTSSQLNRMGCDVSVVTSYAAASVQLAIHNFRVMVVDASSLLNSDVNTLLNNSLAVPVILMAGSHQLAVYRAELPEVRGFIEKPADASDIFNSIIDVIGSDSMYDRVDSQASTTIPDCNGMHFLVVEDNLINQEVARAFLEQSGASVSLANDGMECLALFEKQQYDVIFMDIQMPKMDGYNATKHLRNTPKGRDIPIIAMTANAMRQDIDKAMAVGMNAHVAKPILPEDLWATLQRVVSQLPHSVLV